MTTLGVKGQPSLLMAGLSSEGSAALESVTANNIITINSPLQIRRGYRYNSEIIFIIFSIKTYVVTSH